MKKFIPISLLLLSVACARQEIPQDTPPEEGGIVSLGVSIAPQQVKTALGPYDSGKYPTLWQEGDQISVNGKTSAALTKDQAGKSTAQFSFRGKITAPFNFLYPATVSEDIVTFPARQNYRVGTFDPASVPMWGTADEFTDAQLSHLSSLLRFDVKGSCTLKEISLSAVGGEALSGNFRMIKDEKGAFTGVMQEDEETSATLLYSFGEEGLALDAETPVPVYIAIPYGTYDRGFRAFLTSSDDKKMVLTFFSEGKEVKPSKVLHFDKAVNFVPGADEVDYIYTPEELAGLEYSVNSKAYLMNDIDITQFSEWKAIPAYNGVIDGLDHKLTASGPLFTQSADSMKIKNVNFTSSTTAAGPFIDISNGYAVFESCSFSMMTDSPFKLTGGDLKISGCSFTDNCTDVSKVSGVTMTGGNLEVSGSIFKDNGSSSNSQSVINCGINCKGSLITFSNCVFDSNESSGSSNGVMAMVQAFAGTVYMTNCVVTGNVNSRYGIIHQSANTGGAKGTGDTESFIGINNCLFYDNHGNSKTAYDGCNISLAGRHLIMNSTFVNTAAHKSIMNLRCGALEMSGISVGGAKSSVIVNNIFRNETESEGTYCFDAGAKEKYYQTLIGYNRYNKGVQPDHGGVTFDAADISADTPGTYNSEDYLWTWTPSSDDKAAMLSSDIETYVAGKTDPSFSDYVTSYFTWLKSQKFDSHNALEVDLYGNVRDKSQYWPGCYQANQ